MGLFSKRRQGAVNRRKQSRQEALKAGLKTSARWARHAVTALLVVSVVVGVPLGVLYGWEHIASIGYFRVASVEVSGNSQVTREEVVALLGCGEGAGASSVFALVPREAEGRLVGHPWVRRAQVERVLPDRVRVVLEEREVGGLVMLDQLYIADREGVPFKTIGLEEGLDGAIVTGLRGRPEELTGLDHARIREAFEVMSRYEALGLGSYDGLSEVQVDPLLGVTLVTERRFMRVYLGEGRLGERLWRLGEIYGELASRGMAAREVRLDSDRSLRRIAVSLDKPGGAGAQ